MNTQTFFFYDLETSGLSPREDRIMQFAGQRTDLNLKKIGDPVNLLLKMSNDTLPSPYAIQVTGITPQSTQQDGLTEAEFCKYVQEEIFTPGTIATGYNSVRFDDEHMRHTFWRNFYDPYEWEWKDNRSRWDLLDVVRMTRALRPEGINWPITEDGRPTNRLELITKLNGISHESAHDALSDVDALIDVTRLIKEKQPKLYNFLFRYRDKHSLKSFVSLDSPTPFVYSSGRYSSKYNFTTVAYPLAPSRNGNILVFDLRYNLEELMDSADEIDKKTGKKKDKFYPVVKELAYNKCPAVAPINVLNVENGWEKVSLSSEKVQKNLEILKKYPDFAEKMSEKFKNSPEFPPSFDPESALYDSFVPDTDKIRCNAVRNANANALADFHPNFVDERLPELLLHYKAKNFPSSLSESEEKTWEEYRISRLKRQEPKFLEELESMKKSGAEPFLIEELKLWYESLSQ